MANLDKFTRSNEDIYREVQLLSGSTPFDLDDFSDIDITVKHKFSHIEIASFNLVAGTITKEDAANGILSFIIDRSDTEGEQTGIYQYEVTTQEADVEYEDNLRYRDFIGDCFILIPEL